MLLTRASEYALLTLDVMKDENAPIGVEQLATRLSIPKSFLAKILQSLAKQGILESRKGAHGGFLLTSDINEISVIDVILASEGKRPLVFDCSSHMDSCPNGSIGTCTISPFLTKFQKNIDDFLDELYLGDLIN